MKMPEVLTLMQLIALGVHAKPGEWRPLKGGCRKPPMGSQLMWTRQADSARCPRGSSDAQKPLPATLSPGCAWGRSAGRFRPSRDEQSESDGLTT